MKTVYLADDTEGHHPLKRYVSNPRGPSFITSSTESDPLRPEDSTSERSSVKSALPWWPMK